MKVIILAGGRPSSIDEADGKVPKPMAEIGNRPILWHIMKQFGHYGFNDFIICAGYKSTVIKEYFLNFYINQSDITVDLQNNDITIHKKQNENWRVSVFDTGVDTPVTQRIKFVKDYIGDDDFIVTFGDCISNINIAEMVELHKKNSKLATVAITRPTGRNEILSLDPDGVFDFREKTIEYYNNAWVNACVMIFQKEIFHYLKDGDEILEESTLKELSSNDLIQTYKHNGFWLPVETMRNKTYLESLWLQDHPPWKIWES